jgi:hypothetical protein
MAYRSEGTPKRKRTTTIKHSRSKAEENFPFEKKAGVAKAQNSGTKIGYEYHEGSANKEKHTTNDPESTTSKANETIVPTELNKEVTDQGQSSGGLRKKDPKSPRYYPPFQTCLMTACLRSSMLGLALCSGSNKSRNNKNWIKVRWDGLGEQMGKWISQYLGINCPAGARKFLTKRVAKFQRDRLYRYIQKMSHAVVVPFYAPHFRQENLLECRSVRRVLA